jgi:1-aminocyclopropane-1-carboxylate deaminase/D-cysteine desulfhydrase-like pyridoxal-dependent ACC family enzyme
VSNVGHGLAAACLEFPSLSCVVVCPRTKNHPVPESVNAARALGAEVHFVPANRLSINYSQARRHVEEMGGVMLPFGIECPEAVEAVASEAAHLPQDLARDATLIVCCGSGVTLAGLLRGLPVSPRRIVGISSGRGVAQIERCVARHIGKLPSHVKIYPPTIPYHDAPDLKCPFPCHPNYDLKAWEHLVRHLEVYEDPILFWNVGG